MTRTTEYVSAVINTIYFMCVNKHGSAVIYAMVDDMNKYGSAEIYAVYFIMAWLSFPVYSVVVCAWLMTRKVHR